LAVEWPTLDATALHGLAGEFVKTVEPTSEADPAALLAIFLTSFGCMVGPSPHMLVSGRAHPPRLNTLIVGESSFARKGTAQGVVNAIMRQVDKQFYNTNHSSPIHVIDGIGSGQGLVKAVWDIDDYANKHHAHADKRLLVIEEEFVQVLRTAAYGSLSTVLRKAFDDGTMRIITKRNPIILEDAHVSLIGHITLEELQARLPRVEVMNGFANRFMFICSKRSKVLPEPLKPDRSVVGGIVEDVTKALKNGALVGQLRRSSSAQTQWNEFYTNIDDKQRGVVGAVIARSMVHVLRLSIAYALLDRSDTIELPHQLAAEALWKYAEDSVRFVFDVPLMSANGEKLFNALMAAGSTGLTMTQMLSLFSNHTEVARAAHEELERLGHVVVETIPTAGRPKKVSKLAVYTMTAELGLEETADSSEISELSEK
jgi:hypothetical protein